MSERALAETVLNELEDLFESFTPLEISVFFRKMYSSYLRECADAGLEDNFEHESIMADQFFFVFEAAIEDALAKQMCRL